MMSVTVFVIFSYKVCGISPLSLSPSVLAIINKSNKSPGPWGQAAREAVSAVTKRKLSAVET